jgi:RNA polymerase sigma-70 factor (ECF subfamily)
MATPPAPLRGRDQIRDDFGSVVREHRTQLISFLRRYTADEHAAADLAQDTFVKAYFQLARFDDSRPFAPWLFTIAANIARDFLRKNSREHSLPEHENDIAAPTHLAPDRALVARERQAAVDAAISSLPSALREPILLHYQLDWPVAEIAAHLHLEPGAVKTRLHRARRALQQILNAEPVHE